MATRLYGVATTAAPISPTPDAGWQSTTGFVSRSLSTSKAAATETQSAVSVASGANNETLGFQLISAPLSAQTISGTVTIMTRGRELAANDNINRRARGIRVVSNDGSTVRGTLLAQGFHSSTTELGTSLAGYQAANATSLSSVSAQDGDRIVVEIGYGMSSTGTSPQYDMLIGGNGTDLSNTDGTTTGTVPWVEFSADLAFQPPSGEYTILTTQTPNTEDPASGQERMLGLRFTSTHDGTVVRGRWYVGATATSAAVTALWQLWRTSDTTKLVEVDVQALGDSTTNGWIEFDVPDTAITASTQYVVTRYTDDGYPFNYIDPGTFPATNGPLSADSGVFINNQTSSTYPSNDDTAMFFADVVVSYGASGATATPSVVAGTATVPAATVNAGSAVTPTAVAATAGVPAATVRIGAAISPATVAATAAMPTPTPTAGSAVTPTAVAAAATLPAATVQAGSTPDASTIAAVATVPAPTVSAGGATAQPATVQATAAIPTATVAAGAGATPAVVAGTSAIPAPTLSAGSTVTPATVAATAAVPMPSVSAGGSVTINPSTVTTATAFPAATTRAGSAIAATTVTAAATVNAPSPSAGAVVTLTTINGVAAVLAPTVATTGGATVTPATIAAVAAIPTVTTVQVQGAAPRAVASTPAGRQQTSSRPRQTTASHTGRYVTTGRPR